MHGDASYIRHNSGTQQQQAPSLNSGLWKGQILTFLEKCYSPEFALSVETLIGSKADRMRRRQKTVSLVWPEEASIHNEVTPAVIG